MKTFFFCGIGGSGMSAIAQVLIHQGYRVRGSDRNRDREINLPLYRSLELQGITLHPQDGSGLDASVDRLVVSTAVESTIPDVQAARKLDIPIQKRAEVLAWLFNRGTGVAVGGTSGKTTVTGMVGHILHRTGRRPTVINGGIMRNAVREPYLGNAICGREDLSVVEVDESDGTIVLYDPAIAVLTNISLDHKPMEELEGLFGAFCERAREAAVVNLDCERSAALTANRSHRVTFGVENPQADLQAYGVALSRDGARFQVEKVRFRLRVPGTHNVSNAAAAVAACLQLGVSLQEASEALEGFLGIGRRLEVVGEAGGVTVIDDFAHNPDKISAALASLKAFPGRLLVVFQPHGFGPTRFLKQGLVQAFVDGLDPLDRLAMPEIFFAGGTAQKDISSKDLTDAIAREGRQTTFDTDREAIGHDLVRTAEPGDRVVVMGARDDTLPVFARGILNDLRERFG